MAISNQTIITKLDQSETYFAEQIDKIYQREVLGLAINCEDDKVLDKIYNLITALRYRVDRVIYDDTTYKLYDCLERTIPFDLYDSVIDPNYISIPGIIIPDSAAVYNTFLKLLDTPDSYDGYANNLVYVNPDEEELSFYSLDSKKLVDPNITPLWTLFNTDGTTPYTPSTSSSKNITVDIGVKANINATYKYPVPDSTHTVPTSVSGSFGTTLPAPDVDSAPLIQNTIVADTTFNVILSKPKTGLITDLLTGQVSMATGFDTTTDSISIMFRGRSYLGYSSSTSLTSGDIVSLANKAFASSRVRTINNVSAGSGLYTYYVYNASFGDLTNVIMDNAEPILGAFTKLSDVSIINDAGATILMRVYKSNATLAFTNNTLSFS